MKKISIVFIVLAAVFACDRNTKTEQEEIRIALQHGIETWQYAIRKQSYKMLKEIEYTPGTPDDFESEYEEYYYKNMMILSHTTPEKTIIDGGEYNMTAVSIAAEVINRSDNSARGMVNGTVRMIIPVNEKRGWKIYDTLLMHNM